MIEARVRRIGVEYIVIVPHDEAKRLGLSDGQAVEFELRPVDAESPLKPDLREALMRSWDEDREAYEYLAGR